VLTVTCPAHYHKPLAHVSTLRRPTC
jgi:hypothetical protein